MSMTKALIQGPGVRKITKIDTGIASAESGMHFVFKERTLFAVGGKGLAVFDLSSPTEPALLKKMDTGVLSHAGRYSSSLPLALLSSACHLLARPAPPPPHATPTPSCLLHPSNTHARTRTHIAYTTLPRPVQVQLRFGCERARPLHLWWQWAGRL